MGNSRKLNLIGQTFGLWTVIDEAEPRRDKNGTIIGATWVCRCECGTIKCISSKQLKNKPNTNGCGCGLRKKTITFNNEYKCLECTTRNGKKFLFDEEDLDLVVDGAWYVGNNGYVLERSKKRARLLHREIMNPSPDMYVDHINGNRMDNRRCNLRIASSTENHANSKISTNNTSKHANVFWQKGYDKWCVQIQKNGEIYRSFHDSYDEACQIAEEKHKELFGEFSFYNSRKEKNVS